MPETLETLNSTAARPAALARQQFLARGPLLIADWERALFLHFETPATVLQRHVPFDLDLFEGRAFVSLVAFTMRGMRLARGGRLGRWLCAPLAEQRFLNVRTYVRHGAEPGIHFIAEWISQWLCVPFGPMTYGLPYRWGKLSFEHAHERGAVRGCVEARRGGGNLEYVARPSGPTNGWRFDVAEAGSLDEFLIERYTAFTQHGHRRRLFRIWHEPWHAAQAKVELVDDSLLQRHLPWWSSARFVSANYSPGVSGIWMSRPLAEALSHE